VSSTENAAPLCEALTYTCSGKCENKDHCYPGMVCHESEKDHYCSFEAVEGASSTSLRKAFKTNMKSQTMKQLWCKGNPYSWEMIETKKVNSITLEKEVEHTIEAASLSGLSTKGNTLQVRWVQWKSNSGFSGHKDFMQVNTPHIVRGVEALWNTGMAEVINTCKHFKSPSRQFKILSSREISILFGGDFGDLVDKILEKDEDGSNSLENEREEINFLKRNLDLWLESKLEKIKDDYSKLHNEQKIKHNSKVTQECEKRVEKKLSISNAKELCKEQDKEEQLRELDIYQMLE